MPTTLLHYLQGISGDANALRQFYHDPAKAAHQAGLSAAETAALVSRNPGKIAGAIKAGANPVGGLGGHAAASDDVNVTIVVVVAP